MNKWKRVRALNIKVVVDDKEWQSLRESFLGSWKSEPIENVIKLREYIQDMSCPFRVRRVLNYLTGTAFRIGIISHPEVTKLLNEVRIIYNQKIRS